VKKFFCLLSLLLCIGCASTPKNPESHIEFYDNSCLPTAIIFKKSLEKYGVWSKVLRYEWNETNKKGKVITKGHAVCAYLYPPGKNVLYTYDSLGSYRIRQYINNPLYIARTSHFVRGYSDYVTKAEFLD